MASNVFESDFDAKFISFPEGEKEYLIGEETPYSIRRSVLVNDYRGSEWVITFISPNLGRASLTQIITLPNPRNLAIVISGALFLGCVDDPMSFGLISTRGPICAYQSYLDEGVVMLATPWSVLCLDGAGVKWKTHRLAIEGVVLDGITNGLLHVEVDGSHIIDISASSGEVINPLGPIPHSFLAG